MKKNLKGILFSFCLIFTAIPSSASACPLQDLLDYTDVLVISYLSDSFVVCPPLPSYVQDMCYCSHNNVARGVICDSVDEISSHIVEAYAYHANDQAYIDCTLNAASNMQHFMPEIQDLWSSNGHSCYLEENGGYAYPSC